MKRSEFKDIIKEAILELVQEGKLSIGSTNTGPVVAGKPQNKDTTTFALEEQKNEGNHIASLIRSSVTQQSVLENPRIPKAAKGMETKLLEMLAHTAETSYVKNRQEEKFGVTEEENNKFQNLFPDTLRQQFEKMFDKK